MAFILLEGADRCGKSTVAELYKKQGYKIIHMSAPDKKYFSPNYSGESYFEEMVQMYSSLEGQNVVFDRTIWGELIWSQVYARQQQLSEEDLDYLAEIENNNMVERILMYDPDIETHWQRCVDNNEPLTRQQFARANIFYEKLVKDYGFVKKQLGDFVPLPKDNASVNENKNLQTDKIKGTTVPNTKQTTDNNDAIAAQSHTEDIEQKLEKANAIRALLNGSIIKKKDAVYQEIDTSIRAFLKNQLDEIFDGKKEKTFNQEEVQILKLYAQRILERNKENS